MIGLRRRVANPSLKIQSELREVLLRERSRADRTNSEFCLVWFSVSQLTGKQLIGKQPLGPLLEQRLRSRIRLTDYVGINRDGSVWLVLVDCPTEACLKLVREVLESSSTGLSSLTPTIYHYPGAVHDRQGAYTLPESWSDELVTDQPGERPAELAGSSSQLENATSFLRIDPLSPLLEMPISLGKRATDIFVAVVGLVCFSPVFLIISLLIRWESKGPALFAQQRIGRGNRVFKMYKFRTMVQGAEQLRQELLALNEQDGPAFKMENDPRITRLGRWLRATSLDEVPQLWNVLRGEMSLVGPRPLPVAECRQCKPWQRHRDSVTPGLTCLWQVQDRRNKILFDDWVRMDLRYMRELSHTGDAKLLAQTLLVALRRRGI